MYLWIIDHMTWALSVMTVWSSWLAGGKSLMTQKVKLCGQVLWTIWVFGSHTWGLLPLNIAMWYLILRAYFMWKADDDRDKGRGTSSHGLGSGAWVLGVEVDVEGEQRLARYVVSIALSDGSVHRVQGPWQTTEAPAGTTPC